MNGVLSNSAAVSTLFLGQITGLVDRDTTLAWILGLAGAALLFNQVFLFWRNVTGGFSKDQTPIGGYRTRHDCIEIHRALNANREKVQDALAVADTELRREIKADVEGVHRRIDQVFSAIANLSRQINQKRNEESEPT